MKETKIEWKNFSLPKESGEYLVTIQTKPYTNEGNKTIFAKFDRDKVKSDLYSYGFTYMDGSPITDTMIAWAEKPEPSSEYFAP